jgi:tRNA1(Val) A37 N6-methylase TrmN6
MAAQQTLLGGKIIYHQLASGHRTGIEPVLLAASIPAKPGATILEAGTGAGAGLLCLARRIPLSLGVGLERDPRLAALAAANLQANHFYACAILVGDLIATPLARGRFDHVMANPPWFDPANTASPDPLRRLARAISAPGLEGWITILASLLHPGGTLTLILPASRLPEFVQGCAASQIGALKIMPLWPRAGRPAKLMIVQGSLQGRSPLRLLAGLTLHDTQGFSPAADQILRDGAALAL